MFVVDSLGAQVLVQLFGQKANIIFWHRRIPTNGDHGKHIREPLAVFLKIGHLDRHFAGRIDGAAHFV